MTPIVNGIEDEFGDRVAFQYLNALDNDVGENAFGLLGLPGHPSYVLFNADGQEIYRGFGLLTAEQLREVLADV